MRRVAVADESGASQLMWLDGTTMLMHHHIIISTPRGSVLVHCQIGMSRSATERLRISWSK